MKPDFVSPGGRAGGGGDFVSVERGIEAHDAEAILNREGRASWDKVRARLRIDLGEQVYSSWFERVDYEGLGDGTVHLSVPTRFLKNWIQSTYRDKLLGLWASECEAVRRIELAVRGSTIPAKVAHVPAAPALPVHRAPTIAIKSARSTTERPAEPVAAVEDTLGSPLEKRFTFDTFIIGKSNTLAHAAARQVATATGAFNPLYVHAAVGLGKTHLLHALAHAARLAGRRVLYLTAERFMYGFVSALQAKSAIAFKEQLRGIDLLLIDDLQFLHGKHVQAEFGHTLNALLDGSRQVVVACDRPPADLETVDERMKSRLMGGLVVEIGVPDEELRLKILKAKGEAVRDRYPDLAIPESVFAFVAHVVDSNARDLDGAFNRLVAHNQLSHAPLTVDMAEEVLRDLVKLREPKRVKIEDIQRIAAKHYNVARTDLVSNRRTRNVVLPRQVAMYLAKVLTPRSLPEIGRKFGGRDHTTVLHAVRKIDALIKTDAPLAQAVELLKRMLLDV